MGIGTEDPQYDLDVRRGRGYFGSGIKVGTDAPGFGLPEVPPFIEGRAVENQAKPWIQFMLSDGTKNPTVFLVNNDGGVYATSLRIRLKGNIPVPDFVFQPNYELMPLEEVKSYVNTYSHLPNIPSEKEIREDGLSVEEMQLKLLQKVEELTLYVIELDEKNKALEAEINELKK